MWFIESENESEKFSAYSLSRLTQFFVLEAGAAEKKVSIMNQTHFFFFNITGILFIYLLFGLILVKPYYFVFIF